jgi:hypothetical protein
MEPGYSLLCLQEPATGPYNEHYRFTHNKNNVIKYYISLDQVIKEVCLCVCVCVCVCVQEYIYIYIYIQKLLKYNKILLHYKQL